MEIKQTNKPILKQLRRFCANCLPRTMKLARKMRGELTRKMINEKDDWFFEDKVLVFLMPSFRNDVEKFYALGRNSMVDMLQTHHLEHLDEDMAKMLKEKTSSFHERGSPVRPTKDAERASNKGFTRQQTIYCQFTDLRMASAIGLLAKDLACDIYWGEPFSPDIIAVPNFVAIVDRKTLERGRWVDYLEFRKEVEDTTPCILVDNLGDDAGWVIDGYMDIRDPGDNRHLHDILDQIREAHRVAQNCVLGKKE